MKSSLAAVKRQRFPARASQQMCGLFILGLGVELWREARNLQDPLDKQLQLDASSVINIVASYIHRYSFGRSFCVSHFVAERGKSCIKMIPFLALQKSTSGICHTAQHDPVASVNDPQRSCSSPETFSICTSYEIFKYH